MSKGSQEEKYATMNNMAREQIEFKKTVISKTKQDATPKTYIFNNAKELKHQEIKLQNLVVQSKNQSQNMGLKIKF